jgi:FkbM family methyltransferase
MNMKKDVINWLYTKPKLFDIIKYCQTMVGPTREHSFICQCLASKPAPLVVQIGANDGLRNDPVRNPIIRHHARCILFEPNPFVFKRLESSYAYLCRKGYDIRLVNGACVPDGNGSYTFYGLSDVARGSVSLEKQMSIDRKSTFDKERFRKCLAYNRLPITDDMVKEFSVPLYPINDLLLENMVDLLVIDAEGLDWRILDGIVGEMPPSLFWERGKPSMDIQKRLIDKLKILNYEIVEFKYNVGAKKR